MGSKNLKFYLEDNYKVVWGFDKCGTVRDKFFNTYWELKDFYKKIEKQIRDYGYTTSILGRKRRVPQIWMDEQSKQYGAIRQAINFHGQSFSSDLALIGMMLFNKEIHRMGLHESVKAMWFIHDSIMFQAKDEIFGFAMDLLADCMEKQAPAYIQHHFDIEVGYKVESDGKSGKNWAGLKPYKSLPSTPTAYSEKSNVFCQGSAQSV